jgi:DNA-binding MarR family transcriptional regulator
MMKDDNDIVGIEDQVCFALYSASNAIIRAYRPLLEELDLTYLQYMAMIVLWKHAPLNVKEMGHKLHLDSGTLTPMLKRLEQKGLVSRTRSKSDERVREIGLTKEGMALKNKAGSIPEQMMCKVKLPVEDVVELKQICHKITGTLS